MEYLELFDRNDRPTGEKILRGEPIPKDRFYRIAGVICINRRGMILATKRGSEKEKYPGYWEFTCGSLHIGEKPERGAQRELFEETGISAPVEKLMYLGTLREEEKFSYIYLYLCEQEREDLRLPQEEVARGLFLSRIRFLDKLYGKSYAPPMKRRLLHFFQDYERYLI